MFSEMLESRDWVAWIKLGPEIWEKDADALRGEKEVLWQVRDMCLKNSIFSHAKGHIKLVKF